ncbi:BrnT family toxin [Blastomonas sp.]|uniref:BrnT family toxin n=1 Tax=Blastomonas sp. TaxID=1909299 RepID=UPI00261AA251|nr:BrnT family toxin [Blastomonas sp.]MDM7955119.1 BrnT family toxin [Blastomonas sp.]
MNIEFDKTKQRVTLAERGLDFARFGELNDGPTFTQQDTHFDYPEPRFQTYGLLDGRLVMAAWTPIRGGVRVISMRKCNEREQAKFNGRLG